MDDSKRGILDMSALKHETKIEKMKRRNEEYQRMAMEERALAESQSSRRARPGIGRRAKTSMAKRDAEKSNQRARTSQLDPKIPSGGYAGQS